MWRPHHRQVDPWYFDGGVINLGVINLGLGDIALGDDLQHLKIPKLGTKARWFMQIVEKVYGQYEVSYIEEGQDVILIDTSALSGSRRIATSSQLQARRGTAECARASRGAAVRDGQALIWRCQNKRLNLLAGSEGV